MEKKTAAKIDSAKGRLGILLPGMGAVASTFIAGVYGTRKGLTKPIGSLTQMGTIRIGPRKEDRFPFIKDYVPLADLNNICFGGWDLFPDNMYEAATKASVLTREHTEALKEELKAIKPMKAVY